MESIDKRIEDLLEIVKEQSRNQAEYFAKADARQAEYFAKADARQKEAFKESRERQDRLDAQIAETNAQLAKTDAQLAKTDAQLAKTDAQLAETDKKLKETASILSNIGINLGHTAEEFFYYSLKNKLKLGNIKFDEISLNVNRETKKLQDEFDIVMYNGNCVALIEIKHKVHPNDIEKLKTKKIENFKILFPQYKNYKVYLGIGGMSVPKDIAEMALSQGIAVLRQKGEIASIEAENLKVY
jgi:hypothetical protein